MYREVNVFSAMKTTGVLLLLIINCFIAHSCAVNPVTGKREINLLSESQEIQLGTESDPAIVAQFGLYDDPEIARFVEETGQKMVRVSHRPDLKFTFRVLDSPVVNAFALPGGFVYFTRGILSHMNSEAEFAGVLGHEIGHVTARHGAKAYTRAQLAQVGLTAGYIFSETFRQFGDLAQSSVGLLFLKFGRDQESESDKLGVEYSTEIGYDARDMSGFFGTLSRLQEQSGHSLPGWMSTHPNPDDREKRTMELALAAQQGAASKQFAENRDKYLDMIDGIVFGDDPRQGFVENNYFYHPTMDFQFPVPQDWQLVNTPQVVQIVNKDQSAGIQFALAKEKTARAAAESFIAAAKATVVSSDYGKQNGYTTEIRETSIQTEQGELKVLSYFIEKNGSVFVFHGFGSSASYAANFSTMKYTMSNFDRLKNTAAKTVQPARIKVERLSKGGTAEEVFGRYPSKVADLPSLSIVNGVELDHLYKPGDRIKVLTR